VSYLVDTNVLLRLFQPTHSMHDDALKAVVSLRRNGEELCVVPQNLIEFWAVATRPLDANGLGLTVDEASAELRRIKALFRLYLDLPGILSEWEALVTQYRVIGRPTHDARLVAAMKVHNLVGLLTFNVGDFKRYPGITVTDPLTLVSA
jgi:predicted nucleic acid-binding protein